MSYARFSEGSVYAFPITGPTETTWRFECLACCLTPGYLASFICDTRTEMIAHLFEHEDRGDQVPERAFDSLEHEIALFGENGALT